MELTRDEQALAGDYKGLFWLGIIQIIAGILAILWPPIAGLTIAIFFGWLLLISGVAQTIQAFRVKSWKGFFLHLLIGLMGIIAGLIAILIPGIGAASLMFLYAVYFLAVGLFRLTLSWRLKGTHRHWWIFLLSGLVSLIVGIYLSIWGTNPFISVYLVGLLFGLDFLFSGSSLVVYSLVLRKQE